MVIEMEKKRKPKAISFDTEVVTKEVAAKILSKPKKNKLKVDKYEVDDLSLKNEGDIAVVSKKKKKRKKLAEHESNDVETKNEEADTSDVPKKKKKRKDLVETQSVPEEEDAGGSEKKKTKSIRERKRKKHTELLANKKMQTEILLQQKSLNYLSKWKHSRDDWRFEKLRQIWLQQNMYNVNKVPDEFWGILVEYLSSSKGQARMVILKEAVKWVEKDCEGVSEEDKFKIKRAKEIVMNFQE